MYDIIPFLHSTEIFRADTSVTIKYELTRRNISVPLPAAEM
jgi:hypothetical protein